MTFSGCPEHYTYFFVIFTLSFLTLICICYFHETSKRVRSIRTLCNDNFLYEYVHTKVQFLKKRPKPYSPFYLRAYVNSNWHDDTSEN